MRKTWIIVLLFITCWGAMANDCYCTIDSCAQYEILGESTYDFGNIIQNNGIVSHTFVIKSVGSYPLIIISSATTCPCTHVLFSKDFLYPGDSLELTVSYDPQLSLGRFDQTAVLKTNAKPYNFIRVYVNGNVISNTNNLNSPNNTPK